MLEDIEKSNLQQMPKTGSEPNYQRRKWSSENLLAIEMSKTKLKMKGSTYLHLPILENCKTLTWKFWYVCIKPKTQGNAKPCYVDINSFIVHIQKKRCL